MQGWKNSREAAADRADRRDARADPWLIGKDHARKPSPPRRTPCAEKQVRARQAELYVQALGLKGACEAMQLSPHRVWELRRWLAGGQSVPHPRTTTFKPKLTAEQRAEIRAAKGREKLAYLAAVYGVHEATIKRAWKEPA